MLPPAIMVAWKCLPGVLGLVWAMAERYGVQKAVATKLVDSAFKDKYSGCKKHPKEIEAELINAKAKLKEAETKLKEAETKEKEAEAKEKLAEAIAEAIISNLNRIEDEKVLAEAMSNLDLGSIFKNAKPKTESKLKKEFAEDVKNKAVDVGINAISGFLSGKKTEEIVKDAKEQAVEAAQETANQKLNEVKK